MCVTDSKVILTNDATSFILKVDGVEYKINFTNYTQFVDATDEEILNVERYGAHHFYWPDLDIDINLRALQHPDLYPLRYRKIVP